MRPSLLFSGAIILALAFAALAAEAQDPDPPFGIMPYASYQGGNIDSVGLRNNSLTVDIPIVSYPQRGGKLKLDFVLHYENRGAYANFMCISSFCQFTWFPRGPSGFRMVEPSNLAAKPQSYDDISGGVHHRYSVVSIVDGNGSSHVMADRAAGLETLDASGINYNPSTHIITDSQGSRYELAASCTECPAPLRQDSNGNKISYSDTSGWVDTMGRAIPKPTDTTDYTGCSGSRPVNLAKIWNFPGLNGGLYAIKLCYVDVSSTLGWGEGSGPMVLSQVQSVALPNGTTWIFEYTSDGNGDLAQITFPTGGTLSYTWFPPDQRQGYCVASPN